MTPQPQEYQPCLSQVTKLQELKADGIVISGMSGMFPMSSNVADFSKILYNKINPVSGDESRWTQRHPEATDYVGKVPELNRFDAQFFMVHKHLGESMDPMTRKILEHSYQAIYDAGMSPKHVNGKKVGVYIASGFSDTEKFGLIDKITYKGYGLTGISKTMFSNRVSYWLNSKGPSITIDGACCGSIIALERACEDIKKGIVESAIVGGANTCLGLQSLVHFNRCCKLSPDGKTRSFDQEADGCSKSEAISVIFLQKAKDSKRAYAEVVHVKNQYLSQLSGETGQKLGYVRDPNATADFLRQFYSEAQVSPNDVEYIEACGTATLEADKTELQAIETVFCENRQNPLLVGSVISNIGLTDAASGVTAITKVALGYHKGLIASNLHCTNPHQDIPALKDGRMRIVTKHEPFRGSYAAINCLSVTGVNSHVLLRGCTKPKDLKRYPTKFPMLVTVSARHHEFINDIFMSLKSRPIDAEEIALFHNIHSTHINGHLGRGYIILDEETEQQTGCLSQSIKHSDDTSRPLWFVYSGMGSQWAGMGAQLMRIPIFAAAIERCDKVLKPRGIDIVRIITAQDDKTIFDNVLNSFVGIAAIQIGITDVLMALGLRPDNIIGHSVGELGCAYADGCLTAEEMVLSAYCRGQASNEIDLIPGAMAAIGLGYQQLLKLCPPSIDIACHNSSTSCTISGPVQAVRYFVALLSANGVFAKEVASAGIAYHSRYIAKAGPRLLELLNEIIKEPKVRSERWFSTAVSRDKWNEPTAKYCSAEYLTNNLLNSVLFEETCTLIPSNAVLVEIAPHGLLQAILKRALPDSCRNIPLTQRGHRDNVQVLLDGVGQLYVEGFNPQLQNIYPKVEFPVSTGTPHIAQFVKWFHEHSWSVLEGRFEPKMSCTRSAMISLHDEDYSYLTGNVVQGNILLPFATALVEVWDTLAMTLGLPKKKVPVHFRNVHLYTEPILHKQTQTCLHISLNKGDGRFEVLEGLSKVATGFVEVVSKVNIGDQIERIDDMKISCQEIYEELYNRGYDYKQMFQNISCVNESITNAQVRWRSNWALFIDALFQLNILKLSHQGVSQVTQFRELIIDVDTHKALEEDLDELYGFKAVVHESFDFTRCGGVLINNIKSSNLPLNNPVSFELSFANDVDMKLPTTDYALQIEKLGDLDTLYWDEAPAVDNDDIEVQVEYAGINMMDVSRANGTVPYEEHEKYFGMDFSGVTKIGARVMGIARAGAARTVVKARPDLLWPVPAHWTLEEAATVPLAYSEAFYYLCVKNELLPSWRVLVQGAAGALGQAAISIALARGCRVFATVADNSKKSFLLKLFPELNADDIGNSRDESFGDMILSATHGEGCNIVISCVRGDLKNISLKCASFSGVTIDMVQIQRREKFEYGMFNMTKQRSYIAADFYSVLDAGKPAELEKLQKLVSDGIASSTVRPLTHVTYDPHEATRAFKLLAGSRHRGRVLLRIRQCSAPITPRIICSKTATSIVVWDGSSLGLQLIDRLISRGARTIRVYRFKKLQDHILKMRQWKAVGAHVEIVDANEDISILSDIRIISQQHDIEGIYVIATRAQTTSSKDVDIHKVIVELDTISRKLHLPLKYFAVITVNTNVGQSVCSDRSDNKLPATALIFTSIPNTEALNETAYTRAAMDVMEQALRNKQAVSFARPRLEESQSFQKLIPMLNDTCYDEATVKELGLGESLSTIQYLLKTVYHVSLEDEEALKLTKKQILEIEKKSLENKFAEVSGLGVFFSIQPHDELESTSVMIPMDTKIASTDALIGGIDANKTYLFIIPGLEGHHGRFRKLCAHLKLRALVLQPGLDRPRDTPRELARKYFNIIYNQFKPKNHFYLLGYEFGINVALELAGLLEDRGLTGTVYCIGGGPDEMRALLHYELRSYTCEKALQEGLIRHTYCSMTKDSSDEVDQALEICASWEERVEACSQLLLGKVSQTRQYLRALLKALYTRITIARTAIVEPRLLRSQIVLACARNTFEQDGSSLQRYTSKHLIVHQLTASMTCATDDLMAPEVVNNYLDAALLEEYETANLCHSYLVK